MPNDQKYYSIKKFNFFNNNSNSKIFVEQRWFAHRLYRYLLIHEIEFNSAYLQEDINVTIYQETNFHSPDIGIIFSKNFFKK